MGRFDGWALYCSRHETAAVRKWIGFVGKVQGEGIENERESSAERLSKRSKEKRTDVVAPW